MKFTNTLDSYGFISKFLHWSMAILIFFILGLGLYMTDLEASIQKFELYQLHKSLGFIVLALLGLRILWKMVHITPKLPENLGKHTIRAAKAAHWALYALMAGIPITGILMSAAAGYPVQVFGLFTLPHVMAPDEGMLDIYKRLHGFLANCLIILLILHIGAGLYHHRILKDNILRRMMPWVVLILVFQGEAYAKPYDVQYEKSYIEFTAIQAKQPITGRVKIKDAQINFQGGEFPQGKIQATVDMTEIETNDIVAKELPKAIWLHSEKFPVATYESSFFESLGDDRYKMYGTLTWKGISRQTSIDFTLTPQESGEILVEGSAKILRLSFNVGEGEWLSTAIIENPIDLKIHLLASPR